MAAGAAALAMSTRCITSDPAILRIVKGSQPYRELRRQYAQSALLHPSEGWREGDIAYLVFDLPTQTLLLFAVDLVQGRLMLARSITTDVATNQVTAIDRYTAIEGANHEPA